MVKAMEEASIAYDFAEKASQAADLETLHKHVWVVSKASKKVVRQIESTQRYCSLMNTKAN
ncbi:MAG: hypothetical protein H0W84_13835 [Bacteroidetes bacterium]|nr:hypothetical protein [Bacteroidota bacterium]